MGERARPMAWWHLASVSRADRIADGAARATGARRAYAEACLAARQSIVNDDAGRAITILGPALADMPAGIDAQRLLGIAALETGDPRRARRAFEVALEGDPSDLVAQVGLAEVEEKTEGAAIAYRAWRRAWETDPGYEPVAARLREARRLQVAEGTTTAGFSTDGSIDGPIAHTHPSLARSHMRSGLHHHAMLDAIEALRLDRSRIDVQLLLAEAWWRTGDTEIAHDVSASILEVAPNCVAANLLVAVHRRVVARDPRQQVEKARQADPFDRIAHQLFAGRDVPPVMEDAWSGDQWSAARASYGEWPVVAVMPRAVQVVRAALAAEKDAAEEAARVAAEAAAEEARKKAAALAASKPGGGAFKGTGVITDPGPGGAKAPSAGAASEAPKPPGFKTSGVITEPEPSAPATTRRRPPPPPPTPGPAAPEPAAPEPAAPEQVATEPAAPDLAASEPSAASAGIAGIPLASTPLSREAGEGQGVGAPPRFEPVTSAAPVDPPVPATTTSTPATASHPPALVGATLDSAPPAVRVPPSPVRDASPGENVVDRRVAVSVPARENKPSEASNSTPEANGYPAAALDVGDLGELRMAADDALFRRQYIEAVRRYAAVLRRL